MKPLHATILTAAVAAVFAGSVIRHPAAASPTGTSLLRELTGSNHGSITLSEAESAARRKFAELDVKHDRLLTPREVASIMSRDAFIRADTDRDGLLNMREYLADVHRRFIAADVDHDGTLNAEDLASAPGSRLIGFVDY